MATYYVIRDTLGGYYTGVGTGCGIVQWAGKSKAKSFRTQREAEDAIQQNRNEWLPCEVIALPAATEQKLQ